MSEEQKPRWVAGHIMSLEDGHPGPPPWKIEGEFIGYVDDLDVWLSEREGDHIILIVVRSEAELIKERGEFNYSALAYHVDNKTITPADGDVRLSPYHLCLLHQLMEGY